MKKFIYSAIAAIGLLLSPSCSDENEALSGSGNEALVSFSVNLADGISTKAISDGETATTLHVDVYEVSNGTYTKIDALSKDETLVDKQKTVNMTLVKGKEYGFVFWAQSPQTSIYSVGAQTISVNYTSPLCNKEKYDAFFATDQFVAKQSFNREVILRRPLAQLNYLVSESDLTAAENQGMNLNDLQTSIWISNAATQLHPFTNTVSGGGSAVTFTATKLQNLSTGNRNKEFLPLPKIDGSLDSQGQPVTENFYYLATTYFLVKAGNETKDSGKNTQAVVDTKLTINGLQADDYALSVQNVPVQWNHRTNIYGNLLTASGQFVVKINPLFEDEDINLPNVETVSSVEEIQTALANGSNTIKAASDFTIPENRIIPVPKNSETTNTEEISFDFSAVTNNSTLKFEETNGSKQATAKNVSIIANGNVEIYLPQSTVTLNGSYYNQVTATTAPNSLYIERGVTIEELIANKGNVHIKGTINKFTKSEGYDGTIYYYISTAEQLRELAEVVNGDKTTGLLHSIYSKNIFIVLDEDIDLNGVEWEPIGKNTVAAYPNGTFDATFDGNNHTISNLKASSNEANWAAAGLFGTVTGATIKNVKLSNVKVSSTHYVGAIVGYHGDESTVTIENCHVDGGTITSTPELVGSSYDNGDKAGGIVGYMTATGSVTGCTVSNLTIKAYRDLGGIIGCAAGTVTGCTATNVALIQDGTYDYGKKPATFNGVVGRKEGNPTIDDCSATIASVEIINCFADETLEQALSLDAKTIEVNLSGDVELNTSNFYTRRGGESTATITINGNDHKLTCNSTYRNHITTAGATIVLNNLTMTSNYKTEGSTWDDYAIIFDCSTAISNVTFERQVALCEPYVHSLSNVTINQTTATGDMYALWIEAGADVTIANSTINATNPTDGKNRAIKIADEYVDNPQLTKLSVSGTTFKSQKKAAVLVTSTAGANIIWGEGNNISEVQVDRTNAVWNDADRTAAWNLVTVEGCTKYQEQ